MSCSFGGCLRVIPPRTLAGGAVGLARTLTFCFRAPMYDPVLAHSPGCHGGDTSIQRDLAVRREPLSSMFLLSSSVPVSASTLHLCLCLRPYLGACVFMCVCVFFFLSHAIGNDSSYSSYVCNVCKYDMSSLNGY